jgi:hypothetical protein
MYTNDCRNTHATQQIAISKLSWNDATPRVALVMVLPQCLEAGGERAEFLEIEAGTRRRPQHFLRRGRSAAPLIAPT